MENNINVAQIFASNLVRIRKEKGFQHQRKFSKAVDSSPANVSAYELGKKLPNTETMQRLCNVLQTTPAELFLTPSEKFLLDKAKSTFGGEKDFQEMIKHLEKSLIKQN